MTKNAKQKAIRTQEVHHQPAPALRCHVYRHCRAGDCRADSHQSGDNEPRNALRLARRLLLQRRHNAERDDKADSARLEAPGENLRPVRARRGGSAPAGAAQPLQRRVGYGDMGANPAEPESPAADPLFQQHHQRLRAEPHRLLRGNRPLPCADRNGFCNALCRYRFGQLQRLRLGV